MKTIALYLLGAALAVLPLSGQQLVVKRHPGEHLRYNVTLNDGDIEKITLVQISLRTSAPVPPNQPNSTIEVPGDCQKSPSPKVWTCDAVIPASIRDGDYQLYHVLFLGSCEFDLPRRGLSGGQLLHDRRKERREVRNILSKDFHASDCSRPRPFQQPEIATRIGEGITVDQRPFLFEKSFDSEQTITGEQPKISACRFGDRSRKEQSRASIIRCSVWSAFCGTSNAKLHSQTKCALIVVFYFWIRVGRKCRGDSDPAVGYCD